MSQVEILGTDAVVCQAKQGVLTQRIDHAYIVSRTETGEYFGMEGTSARIWQLIEAPMTVTELAGKLADEFRAEEEVVLADVLRLLRELAGEKLIVIKNK